MGLLLIVAVSVRTVFIGLAAWHLAPYNSVCAIVGVYSAECPVCALFLRTVHVHVLLYMYMYMYLYIHHAHVYEMYIVYIHVHVCILVNVLSQ